MDAQDKGGGPGPAVDDLRQQAGSRRLLSRSAERIVALIRTTDRARRASRRATARGIRVRLVPAACVLALAACTPGGGRADPPTTTTVTAAPTSPPTTSVDEGVLGAYRAFWDAYFAAADPMDPESPALAEHATGGELVTLQKAFLARRAGGEVIRGSLDLAPRVVSILGDKAALKDCYLDNSGVYDSATGARKDKASGVRHLADVTLVREAGVWKVSDITKVSDGCTAS